MEEAIHDQMLEATQDLGEEEEGNLEKS